MGFNKRRIARELEAEPSAEEERRRLTVAGTQPTPKTDARNTRRPERPLGLVAVSATPPLRPCDGARGCA
jgi:hypothetical protein